MTIGNIDTIIALKSKILSEEKNKLPATPSTSLAPKWKWIYNSKLATEFKEIWWEQEKATFTHANVENLLISKNKMHGQDI